jgi:hypothetical protein
MKSQNNQLKQHLEELEQEQQRLNRALNDIDELDTKLHKLKATLMPNNDVIIPLHFPNDEQRANNERRTSHSASSFNTSLSDRYGYVVCLMLNPQSPPEWSGKEWHIPGKGKCYSNFERANQCLQQLQKRWPTYPFEVQACLQK